MTLRPLLALLALVLLVPATFAEDPKPPEAKDGAEAPKNVRPPLSSDEAATTALEIFEEDYKAKGLKGEERTAQRDWAMSKLVKVQHKAVVEALAKVAKGGDPTLRTLGILYLGDMKALPGTAGKEVLQVLERNRKDSVVVLSALDSFGNLRYVGATEMIADLIHAQDFTFKKAAIVAAGRTRDIRLLNDLLKILGIEDKGGDSGGDDVVVTEGYSWEGAEAHVDTGTPGPGDQEAAERQVAEQMAQNQAAAAAAAGGGGAGGGTGGERGAGGASRSLKELAPHALVAIKHITGQRFQTGKDILTWLSKNRAWMAQEKKAVIEETKRQANEGKAEPKAP
jgi:hypothetical protein